MLQIKSITVLLLFIASFSLYAQSGNEPEIIYEGHGKIIMEDGATIEGEIHHSRVSQRRVSVNNDTQDETYKIKEVKEFYIDDLHFVKVETEGVGLKDPDFGLLLSDEQSAIKVYEVTYQQNLGTTVSGATQWPTSREYYVYLPKKGKLKGVGDIAYTPSKKIAKWIEGCPDLTEKIAHKEKGYSFGIISTDEIRRDVFLRISKAYSQCQ